MLALVRRPRKKLELPTVRLSWRFTSLKQHTGAAACCSPLTTNRAYMTVLPTAFESKAHVFRLIFFLTGSRWFQFVSVDILKSNWKNFRLVRGNHHTEHFRSFKKKKMYVRIWTCGQCCCLDETPSLKIWELAQKTASFWQHLSSLLHSLLKVRMLHCYCIAVSTPV